MMRKMLPLCAAIAMLAPLAATPTSAADTAVAAIPAGRYVLDGDHRKLIWSVDHMGFSQYYGSFADLDATLTLDPAHPAAAKIDVTIRIDSLTADNAKLVTELKGPKWFDAAQFPTATFVSTSVVPTGPRTARVTGNLTLHGVTRPVMLAVAYHGGGMHPLLHVETVGFDATGSFKRSDFGIAAFEPMIGDTVSLIINGEFHLTK